MRRQGLRQDRVLRRQPVLGEVARQIGEVEEAAPVEAVDLLEDRPQVLGIAVARAFQVQVADMREGEHVVGPAHGAPARRAVAPGPIPPHVPSAIVHSGWAPTLDRDGRDRPDASDAAEFRHRARAWRRGEPNFS